MLSDPIIDTSQDSYDTRKTTKKSSDSRITDEIIKGYLIQPINTVVSMSHVVGSAPIDRRKISLFVQKMRSHLSPKLVKQKPLTREMYLLYLITRGLVDANDTHFQLSKNEFRSKILYPNLLFILVKHCPKARTFLRNTSNNVYSNINRTSYGIVQRYINSYYLSEDIIQNDVIYKFLGNALYKFNPLELDNLPNFYYRVFKSIYYYYFKSEEEIHTQICDTWTVDDVLVRLNSIPTRMKYYRDVMYNLQIKKFCNESPTMNQLSYNYNIFKNVIIDNELQNLYLSSSIDTFLVQNNHFKLLDIYNNETLNDKKFEKIRELPIIFKLLKSIHIISSHTPHNNMSIKKRDVQLTILDEITHPFKHIFCHEHLQPVLSQIAHNFTNNLLSGEYINPLTLSTIRINQPSFLTQIRKFVKICLEE